MSEREISWSDYQEGYRQAVFDLTSYRKEQSSGGGVFIAYVIGLLVGALVFKYTRE